MLGVPRDDTREKPNQEGRVLGDVAACWPARRTRYGEGEGGEGLSEEGQRAVRESRQAGKHTHVIATKPTTTPVAQPTADGTPQRPPERFKKASATATPAMPDAAASAVFTKARDARYPEESADPELNPSQPKNRRPAPRSTKGTL